VPAWYTAKLGAYTFDVAPGVALSSVEIVRGNAAPNLLVARDHEWTLRCRVRADTPALVVTALQAFLTAAVNARVVPTSLEIEDATATDLAQLGAVIAGTAENWEDLRVTAFELPDDDGQLVAGAEFVLGFAARRSFPDADGVCELFQTREVDRDDFGNETRRLTTEVRLALNYVNGVLASNTIEGTPAIRTQLTEILPVGWRRTRGSTSVPFAVTYPAWPLRHRAVTVSEVTRNAGGATPPPGATSANTNERRVEDPEKGVLRIRYSAETVGSTAGLTWVQGQRPTGATGETEARVEEKTFSGEWQRLEPLVSPTRGKITREKRTFQRSGGEREGGAVLMSAPHLPLATQGPWTVVRVVETVRIYALGVTTYEDLPLPDPLPAPWLMVEPASYPLPSVDEDSRYPAQRLWSRSATREYLLASGADPRGELAALLTVSLADAQVTL
jgi:hypothetical protein